MSAGRKCYSWPLAALAFLALAALAPPPTAASPPASSAPWIRGLPPASASAAFFPAFFAGFGSLGAAGSWRRRISLRRRWGAFLLLRLLLDRLFRDPLFPIQAVHQRLALLHFMQTLDQARVVGQVNPVGIVVHQLDGNRLGVQRVEQGAVLGVEHKDATEAVDHVQPRLAGGDELAHVGAHQRSLPVVTSRQ